MSLSSICDDAPQDENRPEAPSPIRDAPSSLPRIVGTPRRIVAGAPRIAAADAAGEKAVAHAHLLVDETTTEFVGFCMGGQLINMPVGNGRLINMSGGNAPSDERSFQID